MRRSRKQEELDEQFLLSCENADIEQVRRALGRGADLEARNALGETALHLAVRSGDAAMVTFLTTEIRLPADVRDGFGRTPLHWAAQQGNTEVAEALLLARANVSAKDDAGVEPRIYAEMAGHTGLVRVLNLVRASRK